MARMTVSRGRGGSRNRGPVRKFVWGRSFETVSLGPNGIFRVNGLLSFEAALGAQLIGSTIMRIRGVILCSTNAVGTVANPAASVRVGAKVEGAPSTAAVVADGLYDSEFDDWMMFEPFLLDGEGAPFDGETGGRVIDVKSARKIDEIGEEFTFYASTRGSNETGTNVRVTWDLSIGLKLP